MLFSTIASILSYYFTQFSVHQLQAPLFIKVLCRAAERATRDLPTVFSASLFDWVGPSTTDFYKEPLPSSNQNTRTASATNLTAIDNSEPVLLFRSAALEYFASFGKSVKCHFPLKVTATYP